MKILDVDNIENANLTVNKLLISNGNVGIGTSTPTSLLHLNSSSANSLY